MECTEDVYPVGDAWNDIFLTTVYSSNKTAVAMKFRIISTFNVSLLTGTESFHYDDISTDYEAFFNSNSIQQETITRRDMKYEVAMMVVGSSAMEDLTRTKAEIRNRVHKESNVCMSNAALQLEWGNYGGFNAVLVMIDPEDKEEAEAHVLALTAGGDKLHSPITHNYVFFQQDCSNQCQIWINQLRHRRDTYNHVASSPLMVSLPSD